LTFWTDAHRPTRDLDFLGRGNFQPDETAAFIRDIIGSTVVDDGLEFDAGSVTVEPIREPDEYHGVRVHLQVTLDSAHIRLQIDIGTGDIVTPPARSATLPSILEDFPKPRVRVYRPETIVAEKLHAMVKLGIAKQPDEGFLRRVRPRAQPPLRCESLGESDARTFERRKTAIPERKLLGRTITVKLRTGDFKTATRRLTLDAPRSSAEELARVGTELLAKLDFGEGARYRLAGLGISNFLDEEGEDAEPTLFEGPLA